MKKFKIILFFAMLAASFFAFLSIGEIFIPMLRFYVFEFSTAMYFISSLAVLFLEFMIVWFFYLVFQRLTGDGVSELKKASGLLVGVGLFKLFFGMLYSLNYHFLWISLGAFLYDFFPTLLDVLFMISFTYFFFRFFRYCRTHHWKIFSPVSGVLLVLCLVAFHIDLIPILHGSLPGIFGWIPTSADPYLLIKIASALFYSTLLFYLTSFFLAVKKGKPLFDLLSEMSDKKAN